MAVGAIDGIIDVVHSRKTMETRKNAAAAIFSLFIIDDYKVIIGVRPRAILALVGLLGKGNSARKKDAQHFFNLANVNKASVVVARAVPLLIDLLMDDKAGITNDALAVLALLLGCSEGLEEMLWQCLLYILNLYVKSRHLGHAQRLFDQSPHREVQTWTIMISSFAQNNSYRMALDLFSKM